MNTSSQNHQTEIKFKNTETNLNINAKEFNINAKEFMFGKNEIKQLSPSKSTSQLKESLNAAEFVPAKTELNITANVYHPPTNFNTFSFPQAQ